VIGRRQSKDSSDTGCVPVGTRVPETPTQQLGNLGNSLVDYLKSRSAEHWLFFAIGMIVGIAVA